MGDLRENGFFDLCFSFFYIEDLLSVSLVVFSFFV